MAIEQGPVEAWLRSPWFHVYGEELEMRYKVQTGLAQSGCGTDVLRVGIEAYGLFTPLQVVCQTQTEWTDMWLDLSAYLFGDILAVTRVDLAVIWAGAGAVIALIAWRWQSSSAHSASLASHPT